TRYASEPHYTSAEVELVAALAPHVGNGLRTSLLLDGLATNAEQAGPGMVVVLDDGSIESATREAETWLDDLRATDGSDPIVLHEVAHQARALVDHASHGPPARARARLRSGEWLVFSAARLPGAPPRTAVVVEPAVRGDIAPILVQLHQLTPREREVTQALLRGLSTAEIAHRFWITPDTLRGHVKSVFAKLGVNSRPELAALLSHEPSVRIAGDGGG
ncbi:MAG: helix-turn-helix transcriptional regulator, partial [Nocardioides sp.]